MEKKMFGKAGAKIFQNARELRSRLTSSEELCWVRLKEFFPQYKFRRQHPFAFYITDFYCHKLKLVIEIDGSIHLLEDVIKKDKEKQTYLEGMGLTVLRFTNEDVNQDFEKIVDQVNTFISSIK